LLPPLASPDSYKPASREPLAGMKGIKKREGERERKGEDEGRGRR